MSLLVGPRSSRWASTVLAGLPLLLPASPALAQDAPDTSWGLALRVRPELRGNPDLDSSEEDDQVLVGSRLRATLGFDAMGHLKLVGQIQDARRFGSEASTVANEGNVDLHQGYLEVYDVAGGRLDLRAGRFELAYGDERLVGALGWADTGRAFDGGRVRLRPHDDVTVDAFGAWVRERRSIVVVDFPEPGTDTAVLTSGEGLLGLHGALDVRGQHEIDFYCFARFDGPTETPPLPDRDRKIYSPGVRAAGEVGDAFEYGVEWSFQLGDDSGDDHFAWAGAVDAQYTFHVTASPFVGAELDLASGDGDPGDGESNEFDNFFPTNHGHYGSMDLIGWRNMRDIRLRAGVAPHEKWKVAVDLHFLGLLEEGGRWSDAGGRTLDAAGFDYASADETNLGTEVDLTVTWIPWAPLQLMGGASAFFPGAAAEERRGGDPSLWAFLLAQASLEGRTEHAE